MMRNLLFYLTDHIADSTSLLAIVTALLLIVLYASSGLMILLLAFVPYTVLGAVGIYQHQRQQKIPDDTTSTDAETSSFTKTMIPMRDLESITTSMSVTVDGLVRATHAINDVTAQQSDSAQEQVEVIGKTNTLLDTFLDLSENISEQARQITQSSQQAADISEQGQQALEQTLQSMTDIRQQVEAIGETIVALARHTRRIDDIITSVSEIATQSNLLALNASIEAARAGIHGRGFAVVADEVRDLASQSAEATVAIRSILGEIKKSMKDTVEATQTGIQNVDAGVSKTQEANEVIIQLADNVRESRSAVSDIYQIIRQQADGMEEIAIGMDRIQLITRQNLASTRTVESVSSSLTRLANDLQIVVNPETIQQALRGAGAGSYTHP
ncbi:MAG: methyl-accepting chemotaxis protein [Anaerolineae bacterium]